MSSLQPAQESVPDAPRRHLNRFGTTHGLSNEDFLRPKGQGTFQSQSLNESLISVCRPASEPMIQVRHNELQAQRTRQARENIQQDHRVQAPGNANHDRRRPHAKRVLPNVFQGLPHERIHGASLKGAQPQSNRPHSVINPKKERAGDPNRLPPKQSLASHRRSNHIRSPPAT
jgi:hypothetical protein